MYCINLSGNNISIIASGSRMASHVLYYMEQSTVT